MSEAFDPYYTWLAIPPEEQPADHYRLLGVRRFETNDEVIQNAYYQRMAYIRSLQTGPRVADSQKILNELSAAKLCLLNDKSKAAYDEQLKSKQSTSAPPAVLPVAAPLAAPVIVPVVVTSSPATPPAPVAAPPAGGLPIVVATAPKSGNSLAPGRPHTISGPRASGSASKAPWIILAIGVGGLGLIGLVVAAIVAIALLGNRPEKRLAANPATNQIEPPHNDARSANQATDNSSNSHSTSVNSQGNDAADATSQGAASESGPSGRPVESRNTPPPAPKPEFKGNALRCEGGKYAVVTGASELTTLSEKSWLLEMWCRWKANARGIDLIGCLPIAGESSPTQSSRVEGASGWGLRATESGNGGQQLTLVLDWPDRRSEQKASLDPLPRGMPIPWRHVTIAYTGNNGDSNSTTWLAIDGKLVSVESHQPSEFAQGAAIYIGAPGARESSGQFVDIRQVRISQGQRYDFASRYSPDEKMRADSDTLALFDFTRSNAAMIGDTSGHGLVARLLGARFVDDRGRPKSQPMSVGAQIASSGNPASGNPANGDPPETPNTNLAENDANSAANSEAVELPSIGNALRFSGRELVEIADTQSVASWNSTFTAEMWIRWSRRTSPHRFLGTLIENNNKHPKYDGDDGWSIGVEGRGAGARISWFHVQGNDRGMSGGVGAETSKAEGWHHVAYCSDGKTVAAYLDGRPSPFPDTPVEGRVDGIGNLCLGTPQYSNDGNHFDGEVRAFQLSSVRRYTAAFKPSAEFTADESTLCLLDFSRGEGSIVRDVSGHNRDGKIVGARWVVFDSEIDKGSFDAAYDADNARPAGDGRDLLAEIDVRKHVRRGAAEKTSSGLLTSGQEVDLMYVPAELPKQYVLEATIERRQGSEAFMIGIPIDGRPSMVTLDGRTDRGPKSGLGEIDGVTPADIRLAELHPGAVFSGELLRRGRSHELRLVVRESGVTGLIDGKTFIDWHGDTKQLGLPGPLTPPNRKYPTLGAVKSRFNITRLACWPLVDRPRVPLAGGKSPAVRPTMIPSGPRTPAPDEAALQQAISRMREAFKADLDAAKDAALKTALARKLLAAAGNDKEEAAMRFALLEQAQGLAEQAAQADLALEAAAKRISQFEIDPWKSRLEAVRKSNSAARAPFEKMRVVEAALALCDEAVGANEFEQASAFADLAASAASGAGDVELRKAARDKTTQTKRWKNMAQLAKQAVERLIAEPENVKANQAFGEFAFLVQRSFDEGAAHLAKAEGPLAETAQADMQARDGSADSAAKIAAADAWHAAADDLAGREKGSALMRARHWYQQAVGQIEGVEKTRVEQRLAEIEKAVSQ